MIVEIDNASGRQLDWIVSLALGNKPFLESREEIVNRAVDAVKGTDLEYSQDEIDHMMKGLPRLYEAIGGSVGTQKPLKSYHADANSFVYILEDTGISLNRSNWDWRAMKCNGFLISCDGKTPIIAAMRCFSRLKVGRYAEIPDELMEFV